MNEPPDGQRYVLSYYYMLPKALFGSQDFVRRQAGIDVERIVMAFRQIL